MNGYKGRVSSWKVEAQTTRVATAQRSLAIYEQKNNWRRSKADQGFLFLGGSGQPRGITDIMKESAGWNGPGENTGLRTPPLSLLASPHGPRSGH